MSAEFSWPTVTVGMGFLSFLDRLERRGRRVVRRSRGGHVECRAPRLCRFVPNRVTRRRPNRVIGAGVAYVAGHGLNDAGWKGSASAWRTPSLLPPRRVAAASGGRVHGARRAHAAPAASAADTGTGLIAGSISLGSHDG